MFPFLAVYGNDNQNKDGMKILAAKIGNETKKELYRKDDDDDGKGYFCYKICVSCFSFTMIMEKQWKK